MPNGKATCTKRQALGLLICSCTFLCRKALCHTHTLVKGGLGETDRPRACRYPRTHTNAMPNAAQRLVIETAKNTIEPTKSRTIHIGHSAQHRLLRHKWHFTRTFELSFTFTHQIGKRAGKSKEWTVRGHIHYIIDNGQITATPGKYWISGIDEWDCPVPPEFVEHYNSITEEEQQSAKAS